MSRIAIPQDRVDEINEQVRRQNIQLCYEGLGRAVPLAVIFPRADRNPRLERDLGTLRERGCV
jgi:hypothetical protein